MRTYVQCVFPVTAVLLIVNWSMNGTRHEVPEGDVIEYTPSVGGHFTTDNNGTFL